MSKEFEGPWPGLQQKLQPAAPFDDSPAFGQDAPRVAPPAPEPANQPPGVNEAPVDQPGAPEPGSGATRWCSNCQAAVDPAGKGLCPVCGRFLKNNEVALVSGLRSKKLAKVVDAYRVDLIEQLFAERGGRAALDVVSRIAIENYALVCAQHKTIEARLDQDGLFTQTGRRRSAFDMLKAISETIDRLASELPPVVRTASTPTDLSDLTVDQLIDRVTTTLRMLLDMRDEQRKGQAFIAGAVEALGDSEGYLVLESGDLGYDEQEAARVPAPAPICAYGCGTLTRCAELKERAIDAWRALHFKDPEEVERRTRKRRPS